MSDREPARKGYRRVLLKLGGYLAILSPNYRRASNLYFDDYTHITPLSDVGLSDWLVAEGFRIVSLEPGFLPYSLKGARLPITRFFVRCWLNSPLKPWGKQMLIVARRS